MAPRLGLADPCGPGSSVQEKPKGATLATEAQRAVWREVFAQPIGGGPTTRGFDLYFGTDVPNHPPFCFIENDRTVGIPSEFLTARLVGNNQASIQGPALAGWTLEPSPARARRPGRRFHHRIREETGALPALPAADLAAHAALGE